MLKECDYCSTSFEARRSDAKYCSKTCKNEAYLARKAALTDNKDHNMSTIGSIEKNHTMTNRSAHELRELLQNQKNIALGNNGDTILQHLLSEKDNSGDYKSENAELRIKLLFAQRDLEVAEKKVVELEAENDRLYDKVDNFEESGANKLINFLEKNPAITMPLVAKITGSPISTQHIGSKQDGKTGEKEDTTQQQIRINNSVYQMGKVYQDPVTVLEDLANWVVANPQMALAMLSQIKPSETSTTEDDKN